MSSESQISGAPWQGGTGYVADRPFEVAIVCSFDHHDGDTDARNLKTADHFMLVWHRDGGNRSQSRGLALSLQTKLLVELAGLPGLVQLRVQENRQAVSQAQGAHDGQCAPLQLPHVSRRNAAKDNSHGVFPSRVSGRAGDAM